MCLSHDAGQFKHIFLDSSDDSIGGRQLAWLARELAGANKVALFLHHPILAIDTPVERSGVLLRDRQDIKTLLLGASCEVWVFCGHYHMIDETREANIRQFVTPAVSYQIVKQADQLKVDTQTFGYRILEIDSVGVRTEVVSLTNVR